MLNSLSLEFIESLYEQFTRDPGSVAPEWRTVFEEHAGNGAAAAGRVHPSFEPRRLFAPRRANGSQRGAAPTGEALSEVLQERVDHLIRNYRVRGHMMAQIDPLQQPRSVPPELDPAHYSLTEADLDREFVKSDHGRPRLRTLREIVQHLRNTYCRSIGVQFMHIDDLKMRQWLQDRMEATENGIALTREQQLRILTRLSDAVVFEEFVQTKYIGAKSYSLEGAESLIPLLDLAIDNAGDAGVQEIVVAMAHRGRLNVLVNIIGKCARRIFREFDDVDFERHIGGGDVKYHLGHSGEWTTLSGRPVHLSLSFNPSHLEFVNPVALGRMRAKQDRFQDDERRRGMVVMIHGDAAFCGEGVTQETLNLSELASFHTGGTLHIVVNNQLGFTTTTPEGCSSTYVTDVARMLQSPIFHVNGEQPEAVAQVVDLAMAFRREFQRDVFIDMYCYRRRGHNEGDEPTFTQPLMYRTIREMTPVRQSYRDALLNMGGVSLEEAERIAAERRKHLETEWQTARADDFQFTDESLTGVWQGYFGGKIEHADHVETRVDGSELSRLLAKLSEVPESFHPHPKIQRILQHRRTIADGQAPCDWANAEALALATLATAGCRVRLSGQDSQRGTFSQRHGVLHDHEDGRTYAPLQHLSETQATVEIVNSPLCEAAALGFEYGYSLDYPDGLILWEAQFGDFANAAQVIFDQFIVSAEDKWRRLSGVVVLLPHGFEGQGPEHSSARLERFLTLAAEDNIQVVVPSTPAQYFHCLRQQALRRWRKPLIIFTPKSLLRLKACVSDLQELAGGRFHAVLPDDGERKPKGVKRILLCAGKIYYELSDRRKELNRDDVAILRLEQIYPLPLDAIRKTLQAYPQGTPVYWVQEEPENMGAGRYLRLVLEPEIEPRHPFACVSRPASASPATGSKAAHEYEQRAVLDRAFGKNEDAHPDSPVRKRHAH